MTATMFFWPVLGVAFWVMAISKGINYALGQPSKEQLFIPTSKDAKYKSKAWIDMFGSRSAKAAGSAFKGGSKALAKLFGAAASDLFLGATSVAVCIGWFFVTLFLGRKHKQAVEHNEVVC
jgi:AAA family ATP:ADP antiporter